MGKAGKAEGERHAASRVRGGGGRRLQIEALRAVDERVVAEEAEIHVDALRRAGGREAPVGRVVVEALVPVAHRVVAEVISEAVAPVALGRGVRRREVVELHLVGHRLRQ